MKKISFSSIASTVESLPADDKFTLSTKKSGVLTKRWISVSCLKPWGIVYQFNTVVSIVL